MLPMLLYAGLARAGVISWWLVPLALFPRVVPFLLSELVGRGVLGSVIAAVSGLVFLTPAFVTGARLIARGRLAGEI